MLPGQLSSERFKSYPPLAKRIATERLALLRQLPLSFVPSLLQELIAYDWKFPAERRALDSQLGFLGSLPAERMRQVMAPFEGLRLAPELERLDWAASPAQFVERFTAHLWTTHQIDDFRAAAMRYMQSVDASGGPADSLPAPRLGIVVLGQGVRENRYALFRRLRRHGVYYRRVDAAGGWAVIREFVDARATAHPLPYGHWYIDGGSAATPLSRGLTGVSWESLTPMRAGLLEKIRKAKQSGAGSEAVRSMLARMDPHDLGFDQKEGDAVLDRFQVSLFTEGSGTQLFSTTFVQWAAREALRRAEPVTLLARFAPRERELSLGELLGNPNQAPQPDPQGSLIDGDMAAYYTWLSQQRLSHADQSRFLVWFEDHGEALAIAPSLPAGSASDDRVNLRELLRRIES